MEGDKVEWIHNPAFENPSEVEAILSEMPGEVDYIRDAKAKSAKDKDGTGLLPPLTKEQEQHQFRKMNFLKRRSVQHDPQPGDEEAARFIRDRLIRANFSLLFHLLKPYQSDGSQWQDLFSDAECALWHSVEKYDYDRGNRFIAFARRVIQSRLGKRVKSAQKIATMKQHVDGYLLDEHPISSVDNEQLHNGMDLEPFLEKLSEREKLVVCLRNGLGTNESLTLTEVGARLGISKTRARQLEQQAYEKLRQLPELATC